MEEIRVGISDIGLFVPRPEIAIATIVKERSGRDPELGKRLNRALETTGQRKIRFPECREDAVTLAAQSAMTMFRQNPGIDPKRLRYIAVGTETTADLSKAAAAYVEGMLQRAGVPVPKAISTFQVQHACAGGALAAISVGALLALGSRRRESGLVICSDVARYEALSTAEITQGAGAAALLVENDPELVELDLSDMGFASEDVDDFFRPLDSVTARVKGGYSMQCYNESLDSAFGDYCGRSGESPESVFRTTDYFVLHVPFRNMAERAMVKLIASRLGVGKEEAESMLAAKSFRAGIEPIADIGNTYTASIFMSLAFLLDAEYKRIGDGIVGRRILLASYGSGNTMAVISARVAKPAPVVIARWNTGAVWSGARAAGMEEYEAWLARANGNGVTENTTEDGHAGGFYLAGIREDGYREYGHR
jgi:hydroxymethylglutaryl-CoA synthase